MSAAEKDLRRHARDPLALVLWLGIPLLIGTLFALVIGGLDQAPPTAHLLVADEDGGRLSWLLSRAFGQTESAKLLRVEETTRDEGRARIDRGEATALLVIPAGFGEAVLKEQPTTLLLVTNPAQQVLPKMVQEGLEVLVDGVFYVHRLAGPELRELAQGPPKDRRRFTDEEIARISASFNQLAERLQRYLFPPVINVETAIDEQRGAPRVSTIQLYLPGVLLMALVFTAEGMSSDFWRERKQGTLRRAACTPAALVGLLGGKLLAAAVVIAGCALVALVIGMPYLGLAWTKLPLLLAWAVCSGLLFLLGLQLIQLHASSQRAGSVLTNSIAMPLLFLGGSFFPFEAMPDWMAALGRWTPNGWALEHLKAILYGPAPTATLARAFAIALILGAGLFAWTEWRLRRVFARG